MGNSDHGTTCMRVGGGDGELRPWHYIYVDSIESKPKVWAEHRHPASNSSSASLGTVPCAWRIVPNSMCPSI